MAITESLRQGLRSLRLSTMLAELERVQEDPGWRKRGVEETLEHLGGP